MAGAFTDEDHTNVGGISGSFNTSENDDMQPVTHNSPTKINVPRWKTIVLGGSGGIYFEV